MPSVPVIELPMLPDGHKRARAGPWMTLNCPQTWAIVPVKDMEEAVAEFVAMCESSGKPAFASLYEYRKYSKSEFTVDRDSAIVDRIKFDIDGSEHKFGNADPLAELHKAMEILDRSEFDYQVNFSGSSGFGLKLMFPEAKLENAYKVVSFLYRKFSELTGVAFDAAAQLGTQQKFRIVNSQHQRTCLYAIPLTRHQARTMTMPEIREMAKARVPFTELAEPEKNALLTLICEQYDTMSEEQFGEVKSTRVAFDGFSKLVPLRPCTRYLIENRIGGWQAMNVVAFEMIHLGYTDEQIHEWSRGLQQHKYTKRDTDYHIGKIRGKMEAGDLFVHGCTAIKRMGFCVNSEASGLEQCREMESSSDEIARAAQIQIQQSSPPPSSSLDDM